MSANLRRASTALACASLLCTFTALGGAASAAGSKGVKGDPQPELKPFKIGASAGAGGSVAVESNGNLVAAYVTTSASDNVEVCVLARAGHACKYVNKLSPHSGDSVIGVPQVFALSASHIVVLMGAESNHGDLLFTSTNGGKTFDDGVLVGDSMGVNAGVLIGSNIVYADNFPSGVRVAEISATSPAPPTGIAIPSTRDGTVGVSDFKGGVLVAGDGDEAGPTSVEYASEGKPFGSTGSYVKVGSFTGESFVSLSRNALLTEKTTGKEQLELRFFNGKAFGSAHAVPGSGGGGPEWFTMTKDAGGVAHVFTTDDRTTPIYELDEFSTTSGTHWTSPTPLGNATVNTTFSAGLDGNGSGIVLGVAPAIGYPVLAPQSVSFALSPSSVKKGHKVTGTGKAHAAAKGRKIELQREKSGRWYDVASTHESSSGTFHFTIKAPLVGTLHYRAVASDHAGYVEFGYSAGRSVHVKKK
jgi:hypothetical protein